MYTASLHSIKCAASRIRRVMPPTPLKYNLDISNKFGAYIWLKYENMTPVKSYKLRGAINKMSELFEFESDASNKRIVTCSAGNHAQGVAFACKMFGIHGKIFMPVITTKQKINKVAKFGCEYTDIELVGRDFDESYDRAMKYSRDNDILFVHPFDDRSVIEGQGTVGMEIMEQMEQNNKKPDYIILPIGGGGLAAGVCSWIKQTSPETHIIGVQPMGAPSMFNSIKNGKIEPLVTMNSFVDGASVRRSGELNFPICKKYLDDVILVDEGHVCTKILEMYNEQSEIIEPAGVLSLCCAELMKDKLKGKTVVCIISGGNSDALRMKEISERSLIWQNKRHYFKIMFAQKAGSLKTFVSDVLGSNDDIFYFGYRQIVGQEIGPAVVGIELKDPCDLEALKKNMDKYGFRYEKIQNYDIF